MKPMAAIVLNLLKKEVDGLTLYRHIMVIGEEINEGGYIWASIGLVLFFGY